MRDHNDGIAESTRRALDRLVASFRSQERIPGVSVGLVGGDDLLWSCSNGTTTFEGGAPVTDTTLFQIGSITKTFTATALVRLRDSGTLSLEDPLIEHLPEFRRVDDPFGPIDQITLRLVAEHASGLQGEVPNLNPREFTSMPMVELLESLDKVRVVLPPGTAFKYSNLGYRLLSEVVERTSNTTLWEYLDKTLIEPLKMSRTTSHPGGGSQKAFGHSSSGFGDWPATLSHTPPDNVAGASGLWSCVRDLAKWVSLQWHTEKDFEHGQGAPILRAESLSELHTPIFIGDAEWSFTRGLGWFVVSHENSFLLSHPGQTDGFSSLIQCDVVDRLGVIVLSNAIVSSPMFELASRLLDRASDEMSRSPQRAPEADAKPPAEVEDMLGVYHWDRWVHGLRIEFRDGSLWCVSSDQRLTTPLRPTDELDTFIGVRGRSRGDFVRFYRGDEGHVELMNFGGFPFAKLVAAVGLGEST